MSLDVYLKSATPTRKECHHCGSQYEEQEEFFSANITNNLCNMAEAAGIYKHLWNPKEIGISKAGELVEPLTKSVSDMRDQPELYQIYNASNGWGSYGNFIRWVEDYAQACAENPDAVIVAIP